MKALAIAVAVAFTVTACAGPESGTTTTAPDAEQARPADAVEVTIAEAEIGTGTVTVRGEKPTPCHELGSIVDPTGDAIEIEVWAEPAGGDICAQVIDSFEISFELDSPAAETPIIVNGEEIGRIGG